MQFELLIDTCVPGSTSVAIDRVAADARSASASSAAMLEAAWCTEFGHVDQVLSLWSVGHGRQEPEQAPNELPSSMSREVRRLKLEMPFDREFAGGHIYDLRVYTLQPGTRDLFIEHMSRALPVRKRHSRNVGVWTPLTGNRDQIIHIWAYRDLADRNRARAAAWKEESWQHYLGQIFPLTLRMQNALLVPTAFSPMQ